MKRNVVTHASSDNYASDFSIGGSRSFPVQSNFQDVSFGARKSNSKGSLLLKQKMQIHNLKRLNEIHLSLNGMSAESFSFLSEQPGQLDIFRAESNNILFNLATEEYMFEHCDLVNPVLFLWRNTPTIIMGKH